MLVAACLSSLSYAGNDTKLMTIGSCSFCHWLPMESSLDTIFHTRVMASATVGCGYNVPPLLGPAEYGGGGVQWKWSLLLQQTVFIQYCTSDWISTPPTLVDTCQVNDIWKDGLGRVSKSALYKLWHMAAKLSHETNLAITKLSVSPIHNTIGLGLPMFINVTTRQQISIYSVGLYWYLLACTPTFGKVGGTKSMVLLLTLVPGKPPFKSLNETGGQIFDQ